MPIVLISPVRFARRAKGILLMLGCINFLALIAEDKKIQTNQYLLFLQLTGSKNY